MSITRIMSVLATLCLTAVSVIAGPSVAMLRMFSQEVPCKICVLGGVTAHQSPPPPCWQSTVFTEQSVIHGHCGPAPDCAIEACSFEVTITISGTNCASMSIVRLPLGITEASCSSCNTLTWSSTGTEIGLECKTSGTPAGIGWQAVVNGQWVDLKTYVCNICQ